MQIARRGPHFAGGARDGTQPGSIAGLRFIHAPKMTIPETG